MRVTKLFFCQIDPPMSASFWQKNRLDTQILFDLCLFEHFSPVANFAQQSIGNIVSLIIFYPLVIKVISTLYCTGLFTFKAPTVQQPGDLKKAIFKHNFPTLDHWKSLF